MMGESREGISTEPPFSDTYVWYREDVVKASLLKALLEAVECHGNAAKAFAWDVNARFKELMQFPTKETHSD